MSDTSKIHDGDVHENAGDKKRSASGSSALLRFYWMGAGNLLLLALAGLISRQPTWNLSLLDAAYVAVVLTLVGSRALDIWKYGGETTNGEPATPRDFATYSGGLVAVAGVVWTIMHSMEV